VKHKVGRPAIALLPQREQLDLRITQEFALAFAQIGVDAPKDGARWPYLDEDEVAEAAQARFDRPIVRAEPKEDVTPARGWALDVVEKNSGVPFSKGDREALLHSPCRQWKASWVPVPERTDMAEFVETMKGGHSIRKMMSEKQMPAEGK
jgi:hypothetical protein